MDEDGILSGNEDRFIWSEGEYSDFVLALEFRNQPGTNSGAVIYCSDLDNWVAHSVEVQITDDYADHWRKAHPSWRSGAIFGQKPPLRDGIVRPAGDWNSLKIYAAGPQIAVEMNGVLVNRIDLREHTSAEEGPEGTPIPEWLSTPLAELPTRGHIGLQGKHGSAKAGFRNVRIRSLDTEDRAFLRGVFAVPGGS